MKIVKKNLSPGLFRHSVAVGKLALKLAEKYSLNSDLSFQTGLLHDWARGWSSQKLVKYVRANKVKVPGFKFQQKYAPRILHSYVGAADVRKKGWLKNKWALKAIASHTLGRPGMTPFEKILFVADVSSPDRTHPGAKAIRQLGFKNLNLAYLASIATKMSYVICRGQPLHPLTIRVWNDALERGGRA